MNRTNFFACLAILALGLWLIMTNARAAVVADHQNPLAPQVGRYARVQSIGVGLNPKPILLDTATGKMWDLDPQGQWQISAPPIKD